MGVGRQQNKSLWVKRPRTCQTSAQQSGVLFPLPPQSPHFSLCVLWDSRARTPTSQPVCCFPQHMPAPTALDRESNVKLVRPQWPRHETSVRRRFLWGKGEGSSTSCRGLGVTGGTAASSEPTCA